MGIFGSNGGPSKGSVRPGGQVFNRTAENVGHSRSGGNVFSSTATNQGTFDGRFVKVNGTNVLEIKSDGRVVDMQGNYKGKVTGGSAQDKAAAALALL